MEAQAGTGRNSGFPACVFFEVSPNLKSALALLILFVLCTQKMTSL
jgi:hypothetical protein